MISLAICKIRYFIYPHFFESAIRFILQFRKALVIVTPLVGTSCAYLLEMSTTNDKKRIPLLNLVTNCIYARYLPQMLF